MKFTYQSLCICFDKTIKRGPKYARKDFNWENGETE